MPKLLATIAVPAACTASPGDNSTRTTPKLGLCLVITRTFDRLAGGRQLGDDPG